MLDRLLAFLPGGGWLAMLVKAAFTALFNVGRKAIDDARDDQTHEDVGVLRQKQADTEAAFEAKREADVIALEPRDRGKTVGRLRDGTF